MACEDLVAQCFMDERAPLAVPELNRERTLTYLKCCYQQGLSWEDAKQQIQTILQQKGVTHQGIVRQLQLAKPLLQPWLD
jgi:lipase chaperone LimK